MAKELKGFEHGRHRSRSRSRSQSHHEHHHHHKREVVHIKPNKGFYPFRFGNSGTPVDTVFKYHTKKVTYVTVSDCYCSGDSFQFFDEGRYLGTTAYGCGANSTCTLPPTCRNDTSNPKRCLLDGNHCFGIAAVMPGHHSIEIETLQSCMSGGTAFIRVDSACQVNGSYYPCCLLEERGCNFEVYQGSRRRRSSSQDRRRSSSNRRRSSSQHRRRRSSSHHRLLTD